MRTGFVAIGLSFLGLITGFFPTTLSAKSDLPKIYIDKGACPFECCVYREWTVNKDTLLFDQPNGHKIIGKVQKGKKVKAITGEVHTVPRPLEVVFNYKKYKVGDVLYMLTYLGEGHNRVWFKGEIYDEDLWFVHNAAVKYTGCKEPSNKCWGRMKGKENSTWWIQIELNGEKGWTKESQNFGNMDACG